MKKNSQLESNLFKFVFLQKNSRSRSLFIPLILFLVLILFFSPHNLQASVWHNDENNNWNPYWEKKYSQWVEYSLDTDWLQNENNPFYLWKVDCAKLAYLSRLYFSYLNGLEFVIHSNQKGFISSKDANWDYELNLQKRLKLFARFVLSQVSTRTVPRDTQLVDVSRASLLPGTLLTADLERGHVMILKGLKNSGVPHFIYSTLPPSEFIYESFAYPVVTAIFPSGKTPNPQHSGFRRFLWPSEMKINIPAPYPFQQSSMQTLLPFNTFFEEVQKKVMVAPLTEDDKFNYLLEDLCMKMHVRANVIIDAANALAKYKGRKLTSTEFDYYSTYHQDSDILKAILNIDNFFAAKSMVLNSSSKSYYQLLTTPQLTNNQLCIVPWANNRAESLALLRNKFLNNKISSDPYDSFSKRWGEIRTYADRPSNSSN